MHTDLDFKQHLQSKNLNKLTKHFFQYMLIFTSTKKTKQKHYHNSNSNVIKHYHYSIYKKKQKTMSLKQINKESSIFSQSARKFCFSPKP